MRRQPSRAIVVSSSTFFATTSQLTIVRAFARRADLVRDIDAADRKREAEDDAEQQAHDDSVPLKSRRRQVGEERGTNVMGSTAGPKAT